jgi:hypothetical protein
VLTWLCGADAHAVRVLLLLCLLQDGVSLDALLLQELLVWMQDDDPTC